MELPDATEPARDLAAERVRRNRHGASRLPEHPRCQMIEIRVRRDEDAGLDVAVRAEAPLDPPGGIAHELDPSLADGGPHLPGRRRPVLLGVEAGRKPEVTLAPRREPDLAADPRHPEGSDRIDLLVAPDHVPAALVREKRIGVDRPLAPDQRRGT